MSTIKVDTIATRTGSGNITLSNNTNITGDTATLTLTDNNSHSANTGNIFFQ